MCLEILLEENGEKNITSVRRGILFRNSEQCLLSHLSRDFSEFAKRILRNVDFENQHTAKHRVYAA